MEGPYFVMSNKESKVATITDFYKKTTVQNGLVIHHRQQSIQHQLYLFF